MALVRTVYTPEESCREVADHIGKAYRIAAQMRGLDLFGKVEKNKELVATIDMSATLFRKLEFAVVNQLYNHLIALARYAQDLMSKGNVPIATIEKIKQEMETIRDVLEKIKKEEYTDMRKADYIRGEAAHLERRAKIELKGLTKRLHKASQRLKVVAERQVMKARRAEDEAQEKLKEAKKLKEESKKAGG